MARKPTDTVQLKLRFPEALRRRLVREAGKHGRSLNGEIVTILEEAFQRSDKVQDRAKDIVEALGDELVREIVEQVVQAVDPDVAVDRAHDFLDEARKADADRAEAMVEFEAKEADMAENDLHEQPKKEDK
jgi:hypothetical protein